MIIRKSNLNDASGIAKVHIDSWRTTYKGMTGYQSTSADNDSTFTDNQSTSAIPSSQ